MEKKEWRQITTAQKLQIIQTVDENPNMKRIDIARMMKIPSSSVLCSLSHNDCLSNDDLKQLAEPCIVNKTTVIDPKEDISLGSPTAEFLKSSISNIAHIMNQFIEQNPDGEQSSKARWDVLDMTSCYPEILLERKRTGRQLTMLDGFIIKKCKVEKSKAGLSSQ
ncbi:hypothetical protein T06_8614 [Trichinella sp. T6]|nr:hypothetical protein T06_8614 [Trichinella sp. T6]